MSMPGFIGGNKMPVAHFQWIGLREHLQENPIIFMGKLMVSG
jgi:hypothetical protein